MARTAPCQLAVLRLPYTRHHARVRAMLLAALFGLAVLGGCGGGGPKPAVLRGALDANSNVNPDRQGRPSPVVVRLYQLSSTAAFNAADYFALDQKDKETLAGEMIDREEFRVNPGDKLRIERGLKPEVRFIAITAAFRDPNAQWRTTIDVPWPKEGKFLAKLVKAPKEMLKSQRKWDLSIKLEGIKVELAGKPME